MDGKETAKRKQVLEGNAFYEIDLECMRKKEEQKSKKDHQFVRRKKEKRWKSGKEKHGNRNGFVEREFW
mgnify:CR=1 FL=1